MTTLPTPDTMTVHQAVVEALNSTYIVDSGAVHGQLCPVWTDRRHNPSVWTCNCWHLRRLVSQADAVCAMLDGST